VDVALKEWAVLVEALAAGRQSILLRKGGIVESRGGFQVRHPAFLLFPTFEHQHASFIRAEHADLLERARQLWLPGELRLELWADVAEILTAPAEPDRLLAASHLFIWNERYIQQRYEYRPDLPLSLLMVRVRRLKEPAVVPMRPSYAGCKSWVNLTEDVPVDDAQPVLTDAEFAGIRRQLGEAGFKASAA